MTPKSEGGRSQFSLFCSRRFAPLFVAMFLGAFNDNFFKSAMVILITYRLAENVSIDARILVTLAAGVFILPFVLLSALAGQFADKYERSALVRKVKFAEIVVMTGAVAGFRMESTGVLMVTLFLMGAQSAFFGPLKYSVLPQHLEKSELIAANALVETGTFLAILLGTIFGGLFVLAEGGIPLVSALVISIAAAGWVASMFIPATRAINPSLEFRFNIFRETVALVLKVLPKREIFLSVLGVSWFYFVGSAFLSLFPTYAKIVIGADEQVATLFLAVFSVGIGAGSLACNTLLRGEVSGRYIPAAAAGMSVMSVLFYLASGSPAHPAGGELITVFEFMMSLQNVSILLCLLGISFAGGLYIVPFYAIIQTRSREDELAGVTACTNIMDSLFMVVSSLLTSAMLAAGFSIPGIFLALAVLTAAVAWIMRDQR
ncbi:MAG: MFS transporter [Synergistaceae bacterium]|jgi:acyl-[acyl-carrier-protein]-phospholipid O-acyltransferase/long-chain-fatty-acid--[acyl-carrier-protein] ligase|nr:MFS transporter [Synergistaceae bacterium]